MYSVEVRDHVMIAHSLPGKAFGPAQGLHGATFVVDVAFFRTELTENDIVVDIGLASKALARTLEPLNYRNLDDLDIFDGRRSTTEVLSQYIHATLAADIRAGELGEDAHHIEKLRVTLHESHVARAWYEAPISG
ncbi:MAG: 6-carboxytetrahydropterin synthase [Pseudomonadota bacterium]